MNLIKYNRKKICILKIFEWIFELAFNAIKKDNY